MKYDENVINRLHKRAEALDIDKIGFSRLDENTYLRADCAGYLLERGYNGAISLISPISISACELLFKREDRGTLYYFSRHAKTRAEELDAAGHKLCAFLESEGYHAFLVPGLGRAYDDEGPRTILSHITHARLAGLGTMGDSGMLLTPEYGPRVRLATIVTDCPLPEAGPLERELCTHCGLCAGVCPAGSISVGRFDPGRPELHYTDKAACGDYRDRNLKEYGTRFCNLCMAICPIGSKHAGLRQGISPKAK